MWKLRRQKGLELNQIFLKMNKHLKAMKWHL